MVDVNAVNPANIAVNVNWSQIIQVVGNGVLIGVSIVVALIVINWIRGQLSYNFKVTLFEKVGDGLRRFEDRGKIDKAKNEYISKKFKKKIEFAVPDNKYFIHDKGGLALFGYVVNNSCGWLTVYPNPGFKPADMNLGAWFLQRLKRNWDATQNKVSFWDKYGHQILWGATMVIFLVVIILILQRMDSVIKMATDIGTKAAAMRL